MPEIDMSAGDKGHDSEPLHDNVDNVDNYGSDWQLLGPLPKEIDPASPALHLYWDAAYRDFVCCCSLQDDSTSTREKKEEGLRDPTNSLKRLFCYPHGFERFYRVLEISAISKKEHTLARQKAMKTTIFRFFFQSIPEKDRFPAHNVFFNDQEKTIGRQLCDIVKNENLWEPLETLYVWLDSHYPTTCHNHCHGFRRIQSFMNREAGSFDEMCAFMKLICVFRHFSVFNFSDQKTLSNFDKEIIFFVEDKKDYKKIGEIDEADIDKDHFILCRNLDSCVCIFEGRGSKSMCDLACSDLNVANAGWPMTLKQFVAMQKHSSPMTARWLRHDSGHTLKVWAHMPKHEYAKCETEKCKNRGQKWRHMIYSYAVMALLWNEFNGNKEGPLGHYPSRSAQKMALGGSPSSDPMQVYASKKGGFPVDYVGHNVVALAVGKRGDILRIAYNHNTLFSSTVDHAEERLIDGLYREPTNLVQRSHAKIYDGETLANVEIEKHMQHISVYTSLEPCQQCSGKMLLALVPEVISCQRDWDIRLLGDQLYNQFHKCRAVLASHFDFSPYDDLGRSYSIYRERVIRNKMSFFKSDYHHVPAKPTMPYFLCTDEAHAIFKRGYDVFDKVLYILFHKDQSLRPTFDDDDLPCQFFKEREPRSTVCAQDKIDLLQLLNIDVSDWLDDSDKIATDIRNFRPSLSDKKNRIIHDELLHLRQSWVSNVFKQMCTLTFICDRNCTIDESTIETKLSPLGDITSINLIRTVEGQLKGMFAVTFASYETAKNVKESLEKIVFRPAYQKKDVEADFPPGFKVNSVGFKRKEYIDASEWLHQIRAPLAFELFLPNLPDYKSSIANALNPYVTKTKSKNMFRKWPLRHQTEGKLCERESQVLHIKCTDIASARRLKCELPNFDEPNNIRVTFLPTTGDGSGVSGTRVYFSKVTSPTNVHAGTFTLIARTDVTEGQMLDYLNECFPQHSCSPLLSSFFCTTLTSCNSSQTLKWIDVTSVSMRCFDWKVWSFPFVCKIGSVGAAVPKFSIFCQMQPIFTSQKLPRRHFCQPYPQSVLDFDIYVQNQWYKLRSILLHPEQSPKPEFRPAPSDYQNPPDLQHKFLFNVTKVSRANEQDKTAKEISVLFLFDPAEQSFKIVPDTEANSERSKYVTIDICESSLVTLICSYMLIECKQDVKALLVFVVTEKGGKYVDFWGKEFQISIAALKDKAPQDKKAPKLLDIVDVDDIIDSLLFIRRRNLLGLHLHSANCLYLTFAKIAEKRPEGHISFFCEFCGVYTDFPVLENPGGNCEKILKVCCAAHTKGNDPSKSSVPKMEKLKVGHYKIKNLWKKASEVENESNESHVDPAKDTHPRRLIENIRKTENDLQLEFCVSNKSYRASRNGNNHIGSVSFLLRRDDVFGPAHILFCMYSPFETNESIRFQIEVSGKPLVTSDFGVEDIHVIKRVETVNRSKKTNAGKGTKVYGRLKVKKQGKQVKHNQGGEIPADALRKFLEPEYFPELFALDDEHHSFPFYPTLEFLGPSKYDGATVVNSASSGNGDDGDAGDGDGGGNDDLCKSGDVAIVSLHSWDFSELQTPELSRLLVCQKNLHAVEFDRLKKRAEICEKEEQMLKLPKSQSAPRRDSSSIYRSTVWTKHEYFKDCIQFRYVDSAQAGSDKKLTIPSRFRGQLFPSKAWARLVADESIDNPDQFLTLLDDLVLSHESRQNIADFLPKWASQKFSLGSLVGFLDESGLHWSKYEYLKASIAEKTKISDSQRDEEEIEVKVLQAFLDLIGNGNSKAGDSPKAFSDESKSTIKKYLTLTINEAGTRIIEDLPKIIDVLVSELNLTWGNPNLKCTQLMMEKYCTAKKIVAEKNAIVQNTIVEELKKSMQHFSDSDHAAYDFLSSNGHSSVSTQIPLSQLGASLAPLKPADASWSQGFAAHPQLFQMLDLELPGEATILALPSQRHRPQSHMAPATPAAAAAPSSTALVSVGARAESEVNDADQAEHLLRSFMRLMDINDHNFDPKERIIQGLRLRNQLGDQDGSSNLHKVVEFLAANIQKEKEEKRPEGVENVAVKNAEKERAIFFNKADPIIQAQKSAENFEIANANSVAAFLRLIGYPALSKVSAEYKKAIRDCFNESANITLSSLMKEHPPSCLHLQKIQGYFLNVVPSVFVREKIEPAFGGKTLELKTLDLERNPLRDGLQNFRDCLSKGTLDLEIIWQQVEKNFRDSGFDVVEVHDDRNQSEFGILMELKRLKDCLEHQCQKIPTLTGDYDRAFSACVSLFQNEPTTSERTAAAESSKVDVAFQIVEPESSECREPSKTQVNLDANSVLDAFRTITKQKDQNLVFWYDGEVVSGESTLRGICYEPSKTIYVTAAKGGKVQRAATTATAAVAASTPASPQPKKKLTRKTLQAMTSKEVAKEATDRSSCFFFEHKETCITALQKSAVSGATYQSDWTRASLEAKLVPHFSDESIRLYLRSVVDALLAMKAEADSGKEYSKMLETFIFFLQHEPANMQCQMGLEAISDPPTSSSSSSAASSPTPPAAVSPDVDTTDAESGTAPAFAAPHLIGGGAAGGGEKVKVKTAGGSGGGDGGDGGGGKSIFEKVVFNAHFLIVFFFTKILLLMQPLQFLDEFKDGCDPVEWILETGKELERACDFAMALKYYFAGRMFFARLKKHPQLYQRLQAQEQWKTRLKYEKKFDELYSDLLPMTNAEASGGRDFRARFHNTS
jgi:tRNA(Arg) A34 adenosine deaminase TadA